MARKLFLTCKSIQLYETWMIRDEKRSSQKHGAGEGRAQWRIMDAFYGIAPLEC